MGASVVNLPNYWAPVKAAALASQGLELEFAPPPPPPSWRGKGGLLAHIVCYASDYCFARRLKRISYLATAAAAAAAA